MFYLIMLVAVVVLFPFLMARIFASNLRPSTRFNIAMCCMFLLMATVAFAADMIPAHTSAATVAPETITIVPASPLITFFVDNVLPLLATLAMVLFARLMQWLSKKTKVAALADENNFLFQLAAQGIALAEERAAKMVKTTSPNLTGSEKLNIAVAHVLSFFPKISHEKAQDIVHSVLAQIPGAGATKEAVTLLPQNGGYSIPAPSADEVELVPVAGPQATAAAGAEA